jgi:hypothetical protein
VDAEIEARVGRRRGGDLAKPRARPHHRAAGQEAVAGELEEGAVGSVAHADIVGVRHEEARFGGSPERLRERAHVGACGNGKWRRKVGQADITAE